jgi:hypothetical protein
VTTLTHRIKRKLSLLRLADELGNVARLQDPRVLRQLFGDKTSVLQGLVERMNRTLLGECFWVKGRDAFYLSTPEIHRDLDGQMTYCKTKRNYRSLVASLDARAVDDLEKAA